MGRFWSRQPPSDSGTNRTADLDFAKKSVGDGMRFFRNAVFGAITGVLCSALPAQAGGDEDYANYRKTDGTPQSVLLSYYDGPDTRGFAWQTATTESTGALWILSGSFDSSDDADFETNRVAEAVSVKHDDCYTHKAHALGLSPGVYSYRVGANGRYAYGTFSVKDGSGPFVALNINDVQTKDVSKITFWERTVAAAGAVTGGGAGIDLIVSGGDFIDNATAYSNYREWGVAADKTRPVFADATWFMASGNHDPSLYDAVIDEHFHNTASGHWGCHSFDIGNVHMVSLPFYSGWNDSVGAWLEADLAARTSAWCVVSMHFGPYTTCDHGCAASESYVKTVAGICARGEVDLVLQAHDHGYSKTLPYLWSGGGYATSDSERTNTVAAAPRILTIGEEDYYDTPEGTVYISVGCAGHRVGENKTYAASTYKNRGTKIFVDTIKVGPNAGQDASWVPDDPMFGVLRIDGETLAYDWYLAGENGTSTLFDSLRIRKPDVPREIEVPPVDPEPRETVTETLFYTETVRHSVSTTNGEDAVWVATATGSVRLMEDASTPVSRLEGSGPVFEFSVCGSSAGGTGTVLVSQDGNPALKVEATVLPDLDESAGASKWRAAVKTETLRVGESVTKAFCLPSGTKYWRYADGAYNETTRTVYTYSGTALVSTTPSYVYADDSNATTSATKAFSVTVTGTEPGTVFLAVFFGSNQTSPRHYAGVYELSFEGSGPTIVEPPGGYPEEPPTIEPIPGLGGTYGIEVRGSTTKTVAIQGLRTTETVWIPVQIDRLLGASARQVAVVADATNGTGRITVDITSAFRIRDDGTNGVSIVLETDPEAAVEVPFGDRTETILVHPEWTSPADASIPAFTVDDRVSVGLRTIPGLLYGLRRAEDLSRLPEGSIVVRERALGPRLKLVDPMVGGMPDKAFYRVEVSK